MRRHSHARLLLLFRNAFTLLLLGLLGNELVLAWSIPGVTDIIPGFPDWVLISLGLLNIALGLLLLVSGVLSRRLRELVAGVDGLMVSGPFRYVRRPVYGGMLLALVGSGLLLNLMGLVVTGFLWAVAAKVFVRVDDRSLAERLGQSYRDYCRCTPLLLPHLGRMLSDFFHTEQVSRS